MQHIARFAGERERVKYGSTQRVRHDRKTVAASSYNIRLESEASAFSSILRRVNLNTLRRCATSARSIPVRTIRVEYSSNSTV